MVDGGVVIVIGLAVITANGGYYSARIADVGFGGSYGSGSDVDMRIFDSGSSYDPRVWGSGPFNKQRESRSF
ncbi:hypothetical protein HanIR_Chr17g0856441 [Helianthus annuus]|nr:hypothetical protein HanIR_Chr17g0856441 [Helianthus annuus]